MVKKYTITKEQRRDIEMFYGIMKKPGSYRWMPEKKDALKKLLIIHNDLFESNYSENNSSCPGCVRKIMNSFDKLVESWQTDKK